MGMGPIRREQICRAAASVIARDGFAGTTMRNVAEEAGVSTGMLNHYFANRQDLLMQTLVFVSERTQEATARALEAIPPGPRRLRALLDTAISDDPAAVETWRVWINAYGEAVRLPALRVAIDDRLRSWYKLIDFALEGLVSPSAPDAVPWSWRLDAVLNGYAIQVFTSGAKLDSSKVHDEVIRMLFPDGLEVATDPAADADGQSPDAPG